MSAHDLHDLVPDETFSVRVSIEQESLVISVSGPVTAEGAEVIERLLDRTEAIDLRSVIVDVTRAGREDTSEAETLAERRRARGEAIEVRRRSS